MESKLLKASHEVMTVNGGRGGQARSPRKSTLKLLFKTTTKQNFAEKSQWLNGVDARDYMHTITDR